LLSAACCVLLSASLWPCSVAQAAEAALPDKSSTWAERYLAIPPDLQPSHDELWITEQSEANWRHVQIYQRWAKNFNAGRSWFETNVDPRKFKGPVLATELNASGTVVRVKLLRSSGSDELDSYALDVARAVTSVAPLPEVLSELGRTINVVAVVGFMYPEKGGKVAPVASVNNIAVSRYHQQLSHAIATGFSQRTPPVKGDVTLEIGVKQGRVTSVKADPTTGSPKLNEFAVREVLKMAPSLPAGPDGDQLVVLPLRF